MLLAAGLGVASVLVALSVLWLNRLDIATGDNEAVGTWYETKFNGRFDRITRTRLAVFLLFLGVGAATVAGAITLVQREMGWVALPPTVSTSVGGVGADRSIIVKADFVQLPDGSRAIGCLLDYMSEGDEPVLYLQSVAVDASGKASLAGEVKVGTDVYSAAVFITYVMREDGTSSQRAVETIPMTDTGAADPDAAIPNACP